MLGTAFLAHPYLRLRRPDGQEEHLGRPPPPAALAVYSCTAARSSLVTPGGCGAPLFEQRALLSRQHVWDAGDGPERAWYACSEWCPAVLAAGEALQASLAAAWLRPTSVCR